MSIKFSPMAEYSTEDLIKELESRCTIFVAGYHLKVGMKIQHPLDALVKVHNNTDPLIIQKLSIVYRMIQHVMSNAINDLEKKNQSQ